MRILNFKFVEKWCSDKIRELDWGVAHIKQWQPSCLIYQGDYKLLKCTAVTALVISFPYTNAQPFSVVNATINDTHIITTAQHGEEFLTTIVTNNYTINTNRGLNGEFIGETTFYLNGSKKVTAPYGNGKATRHTKAGSADVKITYEDENNNIYKTESLYPNKTFVVEFSNGTISSLDSDGTWIKTDSNTTQTTYSNGTKVTTTKIDPITTIITHPNGIKITKFKKNGTVLEEDKYGGKIVRKKDNIEILYNDSKLNINEDDWQLELVGDDDHHQEL